MNSRCDIVIAGVGGQGILLASDILGEACIREGLPVKGLETPGTGTVAELTTAAPPGFSHAAKVPVPGGAAYPPVESLRGILAARAGALLFLDFAAMAAAAGSPRTVNVLMLGAAARFLPLSSEALRGAVLALVKPRFHDVNRAAFEAGLGARA